MGKGKTTQLNLKKYSQCSFRAKRVEIGSDWFGEDEKDVRKVGWEGCKEGRGGLQVLRKKAANREK